MGNTPKLKRTQQRGATRSATPTAPAGRKRFANWKRYATVGGVLLIIGIFVVYIATDLSNNPQGVVDPPQGTEFFTVTDVAHVPGPVQYAQSPPVGGPMAAQPIACDVYDVPVANENVMHALEHGAGWITYQPDLPPDDIRTLEGLAGGRREVIISPFPGLDSVAVATTWGTQLRVDSVDDPRLDQFLRAFLGRTAPENAAGC